jgi:hypothetical protein
MSCLSTSPLARSTFVGNRQICLADLASPVAATLAGLSYAEVCKAAQQTSATYSHLIHAVTDRMNP